MRQLCRCYVNYGVDPLGRWKKTINKSATKLEVDKSKWGINDNTYAVPPDFYYDIKYDCCDCGKTQVWTALEQKRWYEELGKTINSHAIRCQVCRSHINALKEDQKRHMEKVANTPKHKHEEFFKKK